MNNKESLETCCSLIEVINYNIKMYEKGIVTDLIQDLPMVSMVKRLPIDNPRLYAGYIKDIKMYILPKLLYIKKRLAKNKKILKSKSNYADYIVKNWSYKSSLGLDLMDFYNSLIN